MSLQNRKAKQGMKILGRFKLIGSINGKVTKETDWIKNLVVDNDDNGLDLVRRALLGDPLVTSLEITSGEIGTGDTPPDAADLGLEEMVLDGIVKANQQIEIDEVVYQFFISSSELPDNIYTEFGLRVGDALFSRALILPTFEKSSGEDITIEYRIRVTNTA